MVFDGESGTQHVHRIGRATDRGLSHQYRQCRPIRRAHPGLLERIKPADNEIVASSNLSMDRIEGALRAAHRGRDPRGKPADSQVVIAFQIRACLNRRCTHRATVMKMDVSTNWVRIRFALEGWGTARAPSRKYALTKSRRPDIM